MSIVSKRFRRKLLMTTCIFAVSALGSSLAYADDSLGEVIVTAQRRSTDLQNTPVAVTAVTSQTLDQSFVANLTGLNATVPSLEITKASGFENLVTIRGVGSETPENGLTTVPGVSLFVDGVYIANTISLDETPFDIQDVEVLRGPQGALYGQSSIGGAINIQTRQPMLHSFDASGDFSVGTYGLFRERAEVNIPMGDDWALRVSVQKFDRDGFTRDIAIPGFRLDDVHDGGEKASLLWQPADTFTATLTEMIYRSDQHGDAQKNVDEFSTLPGLGYAITDPRDVYQDYPSHFELTSQLYHLNLQWDLPYFSVRSVTAYQGLDHVQREDSSRSAVAVDNSYDDVAAWNTHVHNYTEEFDLLSPPGAKLEWIAGGFLLYQSSDQFVLEYDGFGGLAPTPAQLSSNPPNLTTNPPANLAYGNISQVLRRSYSPFAQGTYHVADNFRITSTRSSPPSLRAPEWGFASVGQSSNLMVGACGGSVPLGAAQHFTLACLALGSFRRIPHGFKFSSSLRDWRLRYSGEPSRRRWLGADGNVIRDYRITERKIPALLARKSRESLVARLSEFLSRPLPPPSRVSREAEAALDHSLSQ